MKQTTLFLVCCLAAILTPVTFALPRGHPAPPDNSTLGYLQRVFNGLDLSMNFFHRVHRDVNLDAVIGTRILEATLTVILRKIEESSLSRDLPSYVTAHIEALRQSSRDFSDAAVPHIKRQDPLYYQEIGPITDEGLFELDYASRDVSQSAPIWQVQDEEAMNESQSDGCLAEIFGSGFPRTCAISDHCWTQMTKPGYSGYSLSHQIFYLQIAERFGCQLEMGSQLFRHKQKLEDLHQMVCANMLGEAQYYADMGFPVAKQDLFMEQAALCGMMGFREFFTSEWAVAILSWQDKKDGCYKWDAWPLDEDLDIDEEDEAGQQHSGLHGSAPRRSKRAEKRVSQGCLCHRTTVAVAALAQYVRYILEVWLQENHLI